MIIKKRHIYGKLPVTAKKAGECMIQFIGENFTYEHVCTVFPEEDKTEQHPYMNLNMGRVDMYSLIIPKKDVSSWLQAGWVEFPFFRCMHWYRPRWNETVVFGKPLTLNETGADILVGKKIIKYASHLGSYGMGGPGFFGLLFEGLFATPYNHYLVYTAWGARKYLLLNERCVSCDPKFESEYDPWISSKTNELSAVLSEAMVQAAKLTATTLTLHLKQGQQHHELIFLQNDARLSPFGNGTARRDAFEEGGMGEHLLFQHEQGMLWT